LRAAIHAPLQPPIKSTAARNAVRHIWSAIEKLAVVLSFVGVAYLVYDSLYQTNVTMSFVYSDAGSGLEQPCCDTESKQPVFGEKYPVDLSNSSR
jgi:hypothetical protein